MTINWFTNEQQTGHVQINFDVEVQGVIEFAATDVDRVNSQRLGQNRLESELQEEPIERMTRLVGNGVPLPRLLVWKPKVDAPKVVILDGNHRMAVVFDRCSEPVAEAVLLVCEELVAQNIARVVNTQHGRSVMSHDYMAMTMRIQREQGIPNAAIGRMWGFSDSQVATIAKRDEQTDRLARLFPDRKTKVKEKTLDIITTLEDEHLVELGDCFLDAPGGDQSEAKRRIMAAPAADRADEVKRQAGWLQAKIEDSKKVRPKGSKPSSELQTVLTRASRIGDIVSAFYQSTDIQKGKMIDQLGRVMPQFERLWSSVHQNQEVA